ncbi:hypothetical protein [Streptomyces triticirhizae]|nr:hypothetical protein [Streptomyces triticirhizae]
MNRYGAALAGDAYRVTRVTRPGAFIGRQPSRVLVASLRTAIRTASVADVLPLPRPSQLVVFLDVERLSDRETTVLSILDGASVMGPSTSVEDFGDIVQLARRGISCVPAALRRVLHVRTPRRLTHDEMALLMRLVRGGGREAERAPARARLYERLGVECPEGVLCWAERHGLR